MKKKLLSLVCALALTISLLPAAQALEGEGTRAAEALASLGLVTGTGAGYAAEKPATQEQAAALLVRLLGAEKTAKADRRSCGWAGIPSWARSAVNYCAFHDLIDWSEYRAGGALDAELWCAMLAARARLRL
ncbi:MAG: S-layer homology domain-containing protein [Oscillospiraceae bacterium]